MNSHDELLQRLATGELSPADEPAAAELANSTELRERWVALQKLQAALGVAGSERREILEEPSGTDEAELEQAIMDRAQSIFVPSVLPTVAPAQPTRPVRVFPIAIAAALMLGFGLWLSSQSGPATQRDPIVPSVLGESLELLRPVGAVTRYDEFRWHHELEPGYHFELILWDEETGEELWSSPRTQSTSFTPPPELNLPDRLRWQVWILDAQGNPVTSGASEAFLAR